MKIATPAPARKPLFKKSFKTDGDRTPQWLRVMGVGRHAGKVLVTVRDLYARECVDGPDMRAKCDFVDAMLNSGQARFFRDGDSLGIKVEG